MLLQNGVNVDIKGVYKTTPLHLASKHGHRKTVELLIEKGANVNFENAKNITPLHVAAEFGQSEIVEVLLEKNVCLTVKNNDGKTALDMAKEKRHKKIYRMIYEKIIELMSSKNIAKKCCTKPIDEPTDDELDWTCHICDKTYKRSSELKKHFRVHQVIGEVSDEDQSLQTASNEIDSNAQENADLKCDNNMCHEKMNSIISDTFDESFSSNQEKAKNCIVCYDQRKGTFALLPCGHAKTCETCCVKIVEETKSCPLCRGNVSKYQKIFD